MSSIISTQIHQTHQVSKVHLASQDSATLTSQMPNLSMNILRQYLSKRESECAYFLLRGNTIKGIAQILTLSPRTVEHYLENVKIKLNVSNKASLIQKIIELLSRYKFMSF